LSTSPSARNCRKTATPARSAEIPGDDGEAEQGRRPREWELGEPPGRWHRQQEAEQGGTAGGDQAVQQVTPEVARQRDAEVVERRFPRQQVRRGDEDLGRRLERGGEDPEDWHQEQGPRPRRGRPTRRRRRAAASPPAPE
jgi:hypothetical protein